MERLKSQRGFPLHTLYLVQTSLWTLLVVLAPLLPAPLLVTLLPLTALQLLATLLLFRIVH